MFSSPSTQDISFNLYCRAYIFLKKFHDYNIFCRMQVRIWHFPGDTLQSTSERLVKNNFEGFLLIRIISEWHLLLSPLLWKSNKMLIVRKSAYSVVLLIRCLLLPVVIGLTPGLKSKGSKILVFQQSVKECLRSLILDSLQRSLFPHRLLTTWGIWISKAWVLSPEIHFYTTIVFMKVSSNPKRKACGVLLVKGTEKLSFIKMVNATGVFLILIF